MTTDRKFRGRIVVAAVCAVLFISSAARAQSVDSFDPGANGKVDAMVVQPDGKIVVGGTFSLLGGGGTGVTPRARIARLNPDGSIDSGFNPGTNGTIVTLAMQADGKILVGGLFTSLAGGVRNNIGRLNPDGSLDTSFNPGTAGPILNGPEVDVIAVQPDGKILVGGEFTLLGGGTGTTSRNRIGRLNADGSVDTTFNPNASAAVISIALQPDGKIVVGGVFTTIAGGTRNKIARLNANGSLDTFNPGADGDVITAVALQADGKILVGGDFSALGGVTGTTPRSRIGRLNADGSVDAAFNPGATGAIVYTIGLQADGKILAGGSFTALGAIARRNIGRLGADGSVDAGFDPGANGTVEGLLVQPDGSVLLGGLFSGLGGVTGTTVRNRIGRLTNTDPAIQMLKLTGTSVVTWMRSGAAPEVSRVTFDLSLNGVAYAPLGSGTRVASGWQLTGLSLPRSQDLYIRARGYYAAGYENASVSIAESIGVLRVRGGTGDFDGDGRSDVAVFRPSSGVWYVRGVSTTTWGGGADIPVPGDYDGDGKTDVAVFRPSTGAWFILQSSTASGSVTTWGGGGDIPAPGDYDGDGKTDVAVFRPSTGNWFLLLSSTASGSVVTWGGGADVPVARDYDGDGKTDIAIFRPSTGVWFILLSSTATGSVTTWGGGADIPVAADYDGDGKADVSVFRPSTGAWFILLSGTGTGSVTTWGGGSDIPVPADFDGDGKTDVAVFRPSTGDWFIINSSTGGGSVVTWGGGGDIPVLKRP